MFNDKKIIFYCGVLRVVLGLCVVIQLGFFVAAWSGLIPVGGFMQISADGMSAAQMHGLDGRQRLAGAVLAVPALLALCYGLLRLARLLSEVRRGATFERATIGHLRAFAGATLLSVALAIVEPLVRAVVLRRLFDAAPIHFTLGISSAELLLVLVCLLFFLVTNLLHEGRRLAEENQGFV